MPPPRTTGDPDLDAALAAAAAGLVPGYTPEPLAVDLSGIPIPPRRRGAPAVPDPAAYAGPGPEELAAIAEDVPPSPLAPATTLGGARADDELSMMLWEERRRRERDDAALSAADALAMADSAEAALRAGDARFPAPSAPGSTPSDVAAMIATAERNLGRPLTAAERSAYGEPTSPTVGSEVPTISEEEARARGWRPSSEGGAVPGSDYAPAVEMPGRTITAPRRRRARTGDPDLDAAHDAVDAGLAPGEAFVDALTNRPPGDAPLFDERSETPLDRALGRNADSMALERRRAEIAASGYADTADALRGAEAARIDNERERRAASASAMQRYRAALDRARSTTMDPEGWFHDRGAAGTIGAAIAVGLGALGSGITGGDNTALGIINDSIERDLQAQAQRIESAYRDAEGERTIFDRLSVEFGSRDAAIEASRAAMLEQAATRVSELMASTDAEEVRINGAAMRDQLMAEAAAAQRDALSAEIDHAIATRTAMAEMRSAEAEATRDERRAAGVGGGAPDAVTDAEASMFNRSRDSGASPEEAALTAGIDLSLVPRAGRFAEASTADSAGNVAALSSALDRLEGLLPAEGDDIPGVGMTGPLPDLALSDEGRAVREEIANIGDLLGRLRSGAAISETEEIRFNRIIGGATTDEALRRGIARVRDEIRGRTVREREGDTLDSDIASWMSAAGLLEVDDAAP